MTRPSATAVEQHGFDHIPESDRYLTPRRLGVFWAGINAYQFFFVLGATAVAMGLSLAQAVVAVVAGNLLFVLVAYSSVAGPRAGLPTLTLSRAPFGILGNRVNALLSWVMSIGFEVVNGLLGVFAVLSLLDELGWHRSGAVGKVLATVVVLGTAITVAVVGHRLMVAMQPVVAGAVTVVFLLVLGLTVGKVHWSWAPAHPLHGAAAVAAVLAAAAVIASGPISYLAVSADYARYLPSGTPTRRVFGAVLGGGGGVMLFLCLTGVLAATRADLTDPVAGMRPLLPGWLFALYIAVSFAGAVSNNVSVFYSSGLAVQALGVPLRRWAATALDAAIATLLVLVILFVYDFETALSDFLSLLNIWAGPLAGVWITDGLLRHWHYDHQAIHTTSPASRYWSTRGLNLRGLTALALGMLTGVLTINAPILHGWLSTRMSGADLSWILPIAVSSAIYAALSARRLRGPNSSEESPSSSGHQVSASPNSVSGRPD